MYGTILIADDNPEVLTALKICLRGTFSRIITMQTPDRLLTVMQQEPVDVVLLDMNFTALVPAQTSDGWRTTGGTATRQPLPPDTGREGMFWLDAIRRRHPDVPVVFITAYADVPIAVRALQAGAADFVTKPWDNGELLRKLKDAVDASRDVAPLDAVEAEHIRRALDKCHGNISRAAEALGITRQTLYARLRRYGDGQQ